MSKSKTPSTLRIALWAANDFKCWYCGSTIELRSLNIDHLIPETTPTTRIQTLIAALSLPASFDVNDSINLVPTHSRCNSRKRDLEFAEANLRFYFELSKKQQPAIKKELARLAQQRANNRLLASLGVSLAQGTLTAIEVLDLVRSISNAATISTSSEPLIVTFGINTDDYLAAHQATDPGQSHPQLCDRLENHLTKALATYVHTPNVVSEPFSRTGETISARIAFWNCDVLLFEHLDLHGWEVLEIAMFSEVYPERAWNDLYTRAVVHEYHALLRRDPDCCETCGTRCIVVRHAADNEGGQPYIQSDCPECCTSTTTTEFAPVALPWPPIRPGKDA